MPPASGAALYFALDDKRLSEFNLSIHHPLRLPGTRFQSMEAQILKIMKNIFLFLLAALLFQSCCKDHSNIIPGQNFIPDDILHAISDNGQVIYEGYQPVDISGRYLMSPALLVSSNFDDSFSPGHSFSDLIIEFYDVNASTLTCKVKIEEGGEPGVSYDAFISGQGNDFTLYAKIQQDYDDVTALQTEIYSGTIEAGGIRNLQRSLFMVDNKGNPNQDILGNGQGRLAEDGDHFSERF